MIEAGGGGRRLVPFVVGAPRSGTTLLRLMLDSHPEIAIPAETQFYPALLAVSEGSDDWLEPALAAITGCHSWGDYRMNAAAFEHRVRMSKPAGRGDVLRTFYRTYAARFGKHAWGDKFPGNVLNMNRIAQLLPEARFLHIIRDGRDVAASLREMWWRPGDSYQECIALWAGRIRVAREQAASTLPYREIRYESLVHDPRGVLAEVCAFIEFPYDDAMLTYHHRAHERHDEIADWNFQGRLIPRHELIGVHSATQTAPTEERIGRWRSEMSAADLAECERVAGDVLAELGYV